MNIHKAFLKITMSFEAGAASCILDQWGNALHVVGLSGQKKETHKVSERIDQRDNLRRQPATRTPDGVILSPPFAPVAFW